MAETIYMRVGERDIIDFADFVGVCNQFLGLLRDVDSAVAVKKSGNLRWRLTSLERRPYPVIGVTPKLRRAMNDISGFVERQVIGNIASLTSKGERNRYLSDSALSRVGKLAKTTPRIGSSVIYIDTKQPTPASTDITPVTLSQVRDLTDVKSKSYGMVVGELGSISIRRGNEFRVWDENSKRPVACSFRPDQEDLVKQLLRHRVVVSGFVNSDRYGFPLSVNSGLIETAERGDLPSIDEMNGFWPDITGGLSMKEFFEDSE